MGDQTDSRADGSTAHHRGATLAVLATAPRPGLVLQGACPPLTPAEAGALQTAWLKGIAQELPGAAVHLFGRPADALPMLRYFAGPGVELRQWHDLAADSAAGEPAQFAAAAAELFAEGHGPVLVRTADAPEPTTAHLLACLQAARAGTPVWAPDACGRAWLVALPDAGAAAELRSLSDGPAAWRAGWRRGPWARRVVAAHDLKALLAEREGAGAALPTLPVPDLAAAAAWHERVFAAHACAHDERLVVVRSAAGALRLEHDATGRANGCLLRTKDLAPWHHLAAGHGAVRAGDGPALDVDGGSAFTATDPFGNRLTFGTRTAAP
jgi:hypothetical protein